MAGYILDLIAQWAIFALAATVVAVLWEEAGFIQTGAAAFMGVGAYCTAILTTRHGLDPQLALMATLPVGMLLGGIIHLLVRRLRGDLLAMATLAFGIVLHGIMLNAKSITGGPMGLTGIPVRPPLTSHAAFDVGILLIGLFIALFFLHKSQFGIRLKTLREDEDLADDLGLNPIKLRGVLWIATSALLAFVGGLVAFNLRFIDPSSFTVRESVEILAMALLVPRPKILNASIGAFIFILLPEVLRFLGFSSALGSELRQVIFGIALLIVVCSTGRSMGQSNSLDGTHA